jgi:hypothetical protein
MIRNKMEFVRDSKKKTEEIKLKKMEEECLNEFS